MDRVPSSEAVITTIFIFIYSLRLALQCLCADGFGVMDFMLPLGAQKMPILRMMA